MELLKMEKEMVKEPVYSQMAKNIQVSGKMTEYMGKENILIEMDIFMKEHLLMV